LICQMVGRGCHVSLVSKLWHSLPCEMGEVRRKEMSGSDVHICLTLKLAAIWKRDGRNE
jgi:hypothetical protein